MEKIVYTFIIPHKNSIDLLQRCLNSIPERNDIQIIVVDDSSNISVEDWKIFKKHNIRVDFIFLDKSRGPGYARNIGLKSNVKGKWILFIDSDDFYVENFLNIFDKYESSDYEVIYFNANCIDSITNSISQRIDFLHDMINNYFVDKDTLDVIKYKFTAPWNKMISRDFIFKYNIKFDEVSNGEDVIFAFMVGYYSKKVLVLKDKLYTYLVNYNGISLKKKWELKRFIDLFLRNYNCYNFYRFLHSENLTCIAPLSFFINKLRENRCNLSQILKITISYLYVALNPLVRKNRFVHNITTNDYK